MPNLPQHEVNSPGRAYFDVNGDKELHDGSDDTGDSRQLTWRGDPNDTGSDCSIVVVTNELKTSTYYVHKSVVCFGTRHSKYFAKHLLHTVDAGKVPSAKVELDQRDANNFPIFLDFVYRSTEQSPNGTAWPQRPTLSNETLETAMSSFSSPSLGPTQSSEEDGGSVSDRENVTTENAVSLRHLGRMFENDALIRLVNKFIQKDLNFTTGPIYLYTAWEYHDERLVESSQRLCAENIQHIDIKALIRLPIHLFRVVIQSLESFEKENKELSLRLSEVVCRYLEKHPKARNAELLLELTDPLLMPYIASEAAIGYTAIVKDLEPTDATQHWSSLVRLCRRCAKAVVREYGWSDFSVNAAVNEYLANPNRKGKPLSAAGKQPISTPTNVDSLLFATSFAAALEQAQEDYEDISSTYHDLSTMLSTLHQSVASLEAVNQRKDAFIEKQQHTIASTQQEIFALKRQLDSLRRQPTLAPQQRQYSSPNMAHPRMQQQSPDAFMSPPSQSHQHGQQSNPVEAVRAHMIARQQYGSPLRPQQQHGRAPESSELPIVGREGPRQFASPLRPQQPQQQQQQQRISSPAPMARQRHQHPVLQSPIYHKLGGGSMQQHNHQQRQQHHLPRPPPQEPLPFDVDPARPAHPRTVHAPPQELPPDLLEMNLAYNPKDLISPAQVGLDVHVNKNRTRQELKTKSEMRSKSLLV